MFCCGRKKIVQLLLLVSSNIFAVNNDTFYIVVSGFSSASTGTSTTSTRSSSKISTIIISNQERGQRTNNYCCQQRFFNNNNYVGTRYLRGTEITCRVMLLLLSSSSDDNYKNVENHNNSKQQFIDYEYIPPNWNDDDDDDDDNDEKDFSFSSQRVTRSTKTLTSESSLAFVQKFPSIYPQNTPASLRGEAVRSAIRSDRCVGWVSASAATSVSLSSMTTSVGMIQQTVLAVHGSGTMSFLNSKLTKSFPHKLDGSDTDSTRQQHPSTTMTIGKFHTTCLLNAKGQVIDVVGVATASASGSYAYLFPSLTLPTEIETETVTSSSSTTTEMSTLTSTSAGTVVFEKLKQYIFPLDQVTITNVDPVFAFTLLSTQQSTIQTVIDQFISTILTTTSIQLPKQYNPNEWYQIQFSNKDDTTPTVSDGRLLIIPTTSYLGQYNGIGVAYTFVFIGPPSTIATGKSIWYQSILSNPNGPIEIGPAEIESLRIELGMPSYNSEFLVSSQSDTSTNKNKKKQKRTPSPLTVTSSTTTTSSSSSLSTVDHAPEAAVTTNISSTTITPKSTITPPTLMELNLGDINGYYIDYDKGCYLGQEGIASILKNPRGPPRTLYQVMFDDEFNQYSNDDSTGNNNNKSTMNPTRIPTIGDTLYVLGSNEQISVGTITSIAEPCSTGDPITIGLVLTKRPDSILKQMKDMNLERPTIVSGSSSTSSLVPSTSGSGIIQPPSKTGPTLDGLEVIIGGTYTIGTIRSVPSRLHAKQIQNDASFSIYSDAVPAFVYNLPSKSIDILDWQQQQQHDKEDFDFRIPPKSLQKEAATAAVAQQSSENTIQSPTNINNDEEYYDNTDDDDQEEERIAKELAKAEEEAAVAAAEAKRKAEKMELLKRQAQEAILRRKQQNKK